MNRAERIANDELSDMLARITADLMAGEPFPAGVVTVLQGTERVLIAGLDWHSPDMDREALKQATWRIFGAALAGSDSLTAVFDSRIAYDGGDPEPCLFGMAIRVDTAAVAFRVNQLVVPYRLDSDGRGTPLEPFVPDGVSMEQTIHQAMVEGLEDGPMTVEEAAAQLRALHHAALEHPSRTILGAIQAVAIIIEDDDLTDHDDPDPRLN